jgi:hypothetical protein
MGLFRNELFGAFPGDTRSGGTSRRCGPPDPAGNPGSESRAMGIRLTISGISPSRNCDEMKFQHEAVFGRYPRPHGGTI